MKTIVIAEIGSNHNNNLDLALKTIRAAAEAGATAVKFQLFSAAQLYPPNAGIAAYLGEDIYPLIDKISLRPKWLKALQAQAHAKGLAFLCSAFDEESYEIVDKFVEAHKIASYELTHLPLLKKVASFGKPILLSTGCSNEAEVSRSLLYLLEQGAPRVTLMQCTGSYPAPDASLSLRVISKWKNMGRSAGFSDHSQGIDAAPLAVALGATIIEKHFTLDKFANGPDHSFALEPYEFSWMVKNIAQTELMLGIHEKLVHFSEMPLQRFCRRSVFVISDVEAGDPLEGKLIVLRNGNHKPGCSPERIDYLSTMKAAKDLQSWTPIREGDWE